MCNNRCFRLRFRFGETHRFCTIWTPVKSYAPTPPPPPFHGNSLGVTIFNLKEKKNRKNKFLRCFKMLGAVVRRPHFYIFCTLIPYLTYERQKNVISVFVLRGPLCEEEKSAWVHSWGREEQNFFYLLVLLHTFFDFCWFLVFGFCRFAVAPWWAKVLICTSVPNFNRLRHASVDIF